MATSTIIFALLLAGVAIAVTMLLRSTAAHRENHMQVPSSRNYRPTKSQRSADVKKLAPAEASALKRAKIMARQGQHRNASLLLEQMGLHREAIGLLEEAGLIDDAAGILLKMRKPNRAAAIFARHGRWVEASECFKQAGMQLEAAKCLRECDRHAEAATLFLDAGHHEEAALSLVACRNWQGAGRLFLKIGQRERALKSYESLGATPEGPALPFEAAELDFIQEEVERGSTAAGFVEILSRHSRLLGVIRFFMERGHVAKATRMYQSSSTDLGPMLMSEVNLQSQDAPVLALIFKEAGQIRYAGMVCEQIGDYAAAAESFEACGEFERASYCWDRAGNRERAKLAASKNIHARQERDPSGFKEDNVKTEIIGTNKTAGVFTIDSGSMQSREMLVTDTNALQDRKVFDECTLFSDLNQSQLQKIWTIARIDTFDSGAVVLSPQSAPLGLYILVDGFIERESDGSLELRKGDYFGATWTFTGTPELGTYVAKSQGRMVLLEHAKFTALLEADGQIAHKVYRTFTAQLNKDNSNQLKSRGNLRAS